MSYTARAIPCAALALICANLHSQTTPAKPQFDVASVKPAANDNGRPPMIREMMRNTRAPGAIPMADPGRLRLDSWPLLDLIAAAYRVRVSQVSGPSWLDTQDFNIDAKLPQGTQKEQLNEMLQSLLEERFGLKVHRESETKSGFALIVGKTGPKLTPAAPPSTPAPELTPEERLAKLQQQSRDNLKAFERRMQENRENGTPLQGLRTSRWASITTEGLANALVSFAEAPVADETGLTGKYSVSIEIWKNPDVPGGTIFDAVEKLGLKLESRKVTINTIVVDSVSKMPTAN
jgi:uncharacterized protein (TIGR03435 family)